MSLLGLFKKLLGTQTTSATDEGSYAVKKPRAPRVKLLPLHDIYFECKNVTPPGPNLPGHLLLVNVSTSGLGLLKEFAPQWPTPGSILGGVLTVRGIPIEAQAKIIHISPQVVGCAFKRTKEIEVAISGYLDVEISALKMSSVNSEFLHAEPEGEPSWFHGSDNCELFFVEKNGRILRFSLSFFGNYLEWKQGGELMTGFVMEDSPANELKYKGSSLIQFTDDFPVETLEKAIPFIQNIHNLTIERKNLITQILENDVFERKSRA